MLPKNCAVVGGGINGVMTAWALAQAGHKVEVFERGQLMAATSSASTKLLHGGLRYLETGQFRLVREALLERAWWIRQAPELAKPIRLLLPVYKGVGRPAWQLRIGLTCYDALAAGSGFPRHHWHSPAELLALTPALKAESLQGGFSFHDGQMDDHALGLWAARQAEKSGVAFHEAVEVTGLDTSGNLQLGKESRHFDCIANVAGPWAQQLLERSGISSSHSLDLVRGSHIMFADVCPSGCFLQIPRERRIFFVLPYQGKTLVGTTEVRQAQADAVRCSGSEIQYLLDAYNFYFLTRKTLSDVIDSFSGLRPLVRSAEDPGQATREYAIERVGQLVTVFGGKWTTARQLGLAVARQLGALK